MHASKRSGGTSFTRTAFLLLLGAVLIGCLLLLHQTMTANSSAASSDLCSSAVTSASSLCLSTSSDTPSVSASSALRRADPRTNQTEGRGDKPPKPNRAATQSEAQQQQGKLSSAGSVSPSRRNSAPVSSSTRPGTGTPRVGQVILNHSLVNSPCSVEEYAQSRRVVTAFEKRDLVLKGWFRKVEDVKTLNTLFESAEGAKVWRAYACVTHNFRDMYWGYSITKLWDMRAPKHSPHPFFWPLHTTHSPRDVLHVAAFIGRLLKVPLPQTVVKNLNMTDHNTAIETAQLSDLNPLQTFDERTEPTPKSVLELGCGMGGYLGLLCPPPPSSNDTTSTNETNKRTTAAGLQAKENPNTRNRCAGADITARLISNAKLSFPHIDFWRAFGAPHIATGTIDAAFTHGVTYAIEREPSCGHLTELLRVLKPGSGILVSDSMARFGFGARFSPTFFSDEPFSAEYDIFSAPRVDHDRYHGPVSPSSEKMAGKRSPKKRAPPVFMRGCPALSPFVKRVDFIRGIKTNIKTLRELYNDHYYGVRIFRSDVSMAHIAPLKVMKNGKAPFKEEEVIVSPEHRRAMARAEALLPYDFAVHRASQLVWRDDLNRWYAQGEKRRKEKKKGRR